MINSFRTLLANLPPAAATLPGDEYIPPEFVPVVLPRNLVLAREEIFGKGADRVGINFMLARLLSYAHTSELKDSITSDDARITYNPNTVDNVRNTSGTSVVTNSGNEPVGWRGVASFDSTGRAYGKWRVVSDGTGNSTVTPTIGVGSANTEATAEAFLGEVSWLHGTNLGIVTDGNAGEWDVTLVSAPTHSFISAAFYADGGSLFRSAESTLEAEWYKVWVSDGIPQLKAVAFALALSQRIKELSGVV